MPLPKFSPLQSRLAASLTASVLLFILYLTLSSSTFAYASEINPITPEDHNHKRLITPYILDGELDDVEQQETLYEAQFYGADRSIIGRAPAGIASLKNNVPDNINVEQGTSQQYIFPNSSLYGPFSQSSSGLPSPVSLRERHVEGSDAKGDGDLLMDVMDSNKGGEDFGLRPRQLAPRVLFITVTTCLQPHDPNDLSGSRGPPPQVELYVSTTNENQKPGPNQPANTQQKQVAIGGWANITINATGDVFIGVFAPNTTNYINPYNVEIAASIDAQYHSFNNTQSNLYLIDSDSSSALLVTNNLTSAVNNSDYNSWMSLNPPPFQIFAANQNFTAFLGIENSYCGLKKYSQIHSPDGVVTGMTNMTLGPLPKQQFYFQGLNGSSQYYGTLVLGPNTAVDGNGKVGGGGRVWQTMDFPTQSDGNCAVIFNLQFCDSVAYAVPGNPKMFPNVTALAAFYDTAAQAQFTNFDYAMQQIPCEIDSTGVYSLVRNCTDCYNSYKSWLCSVMIPRCMDYSSTASWLRERNVAQQFPNGTMLDSAKISAAQNDLSLMSSRNPNIDQYVQPGPYKEILPCEDLCYDIVRSCPAAMQFSCPRPGQLGFDSSYGVRPNGSDDQQGQITCNYPGAAYHLNAGHFHGVPLALSIVITIVLGIFLV